MKPRDLEKYGFEAKHDSGIGIIQIYHLNKMPYFILGEYHNKGALSPTVGARFDKEKSIYANLKDAFQRKRFDVMGLDDNSEIDQNNIYYSINEKQKMGRLTFVQHIKVDLSEEEFKKTYINPMHDEALRQGSVSNFFWRLNETLNAKESKFKFKSADERSEAAKKALSHIEASKFPLEEKIIAQLKYMQEPSNEWNEKLSPLEFYGKNGGRKYSELTGFYCMPLADLAQQLANPKIKKDPEKPTAFIEYKNQPKEERWKRLFIFEEEINLVAKLVQENSIKESSPSLFQPVSLSWTDLPSPWVTEKINLDSLVKLKLQAESSSLKLSL